MDQRQSQAEKEGETEMTCKAWREAYIQLAELYYQATGALAPAPLKDNGTPLKSVLVSRERLEEMYLRDGMRMREIAQVLNCSTSEVSNLLRRAGIPTRQAGAYPASEAQREAARRTARGNRGRKLSPETREKISAAARDTSGEFGGREYKTSKGYVVVYKPEHPRANRAGTVPKHWLVMERELGRYLEDNEIVHHINHVRDDNRPENLAVMDREEHSRMHGLEWAGRKKGEGK